MVDAVDVEQTGGFENDQHQYINIYIVDCLLKQMTGGFANN